MRATPPMKAPEQHYREDSGFRNQPTNRKVVTILLIIFGIGSLGYGAFAIKEHIVSPFRLNRLDSDTLINEILPKSAEEEALASKKKDTDGDGLTDYDEVALYSTSPYLPDSDSDGITDGKEVKDGTDPNCKPGGDCGGLRLVTPDTKISDLFPQFSTSDITLKDKTIKEFRQILLDQGYDKESLDKISDDTLLIILEESLKLQDQETGTTTPTSTVEMSPEEYDNLRLLLIELGVPRDEVYSLSNKEVQDILRTLK